MIALQAGGGVVAEHDLLVLGAELEDVDSVEGVEERGTVVAGTEGSADMRSSFGRATRVGGELRATRGGVTRVPR